MSDTIPGGVYLNADGKGYHDANGNPVKASVAEKAEAKAEKAEAGNPEPISPTPVAPVAKTTTKKK